MRKPSIFLNSAIARAHPFVEQKEKGVSFKDTTIYLCQIQCLDSGPMNRAGCDFIVSKVGVDIIQNFPGSIFCKNSTVPWSELSFIKKYNDWSHLRLFGPMYMYGISDLDICIGFRRKVVEHFPEHLKPNFYQ